MKTAEPSASRPCREAVVEPVGLVPKGVDRCCNREHPAARSPWCFPSPRDQRKPLATVHKSWESARKTADFPALRLHDLRHSIGAALVTIGTPLTMVAKMLGHRSLAAAARYAHASDPAAQATAAALSDHLEAARGGGALGTVTAIADARQSARLPTLHEVRDESPAPK